MANLARTTSSHIFWDFAKGEPRELLKNVGYKNALAHIASSYNWYALEVQTSHNILLQTSAAKGPVKPSDGKIWQQHPNRAFSEISQKGNQGKLLKNVGYKNALAQIASPPNWYALEVQTSHNMLLQIAAPKVPMKPSDGKVGKDTLIAQFLRFRKGGAKGNS